MPTHLSTYSKCTKAMIEITIKYRKESISSPFIIKLTPEEYFDEPQTPELDVDSIPRYLDPRDYLDNSDGLIKLELSVVNNNNGKKLVIEINYFDGQQSSVAVRTEFEKETVIYQEKIIDMLIPPSDADGKTRHDLARFVVENGVYNCIYRAIIADNEDGTENELRI